MTPNPEALWRPIAELPAFDDQPCRQFIIVEGWSMHDGRPHKWARRWADTAYIDKNTRWGYRQSDIDRIMKDGDMDGVDAITHWMPAQFPLFPDEE